VRRLTVQRDRVVRWGLRVVPPGLVPVAIDANCPAWLGLEARLLFLEAVRRRMWLIPFNAEDLTQLHATGTGPPSCAASETARYVLCVRHELLPDELTLAMQVSNALAAEYRMALEAAQHREAAFDRLASRLRIRAVAYMQGYTPIAAAMRGVAMRRGLGMVAIENTLFNDRITWDDDTGIACFTRRSQQEYRRHVRETAEDEEEVHAWQLASSSGSLKSPEHRSGAGRIAMGGPYVLFLGQVFTDASIVFGCESGWGPLQVVDQLRRLLPGHGMALVVKAHPKEAGGSDPVLGKPYERLFARRLKSQFPDLAASAIDCIIDADNVLDTDATIRSAACVVTMNSQAGIEAAAHGVPTIVCAKAHYGDCGFTYSGTDATTLADSLRTSLVSTPEERRQRQRQALQFVDILRHRVFVPRTAAAVADLIAHVARRGGSQRGDA
jgi:hypothetical protein